jgi:hypothetical protein
MVGFGGVLVSEVTPLKHMLVLMILVFVGKPGARTAELAITRGNEELRAAGAGERRRRGQQHHASRTSYEESCFVHDLHSTAVPPE